MKAIAFSLVLVERFNSLTLILYILLDDFKQLPASVPKTFIFTGNGLDERSAFPRTPPSFLSLSIGKSATAHFIDTAAQTFGPEGYK